MTPELLTAGDVELPSSGDSSGFWEAGMRAAMRTGADPFLGAPHQGGQVLPHFWVNFYALVLWLILEGLAPGNMNRPKQLSRLRIPEVHRMLENCA